MTFAFTVRTADWKHDETAIAELRRKVFIDEQGVPEALEWETIDPQCAWFIALKPDSTVIGIVRLTAAGRIGRMAVLPEWRLLGVGKALLTAVLEAARQRRHNQVHLSAQTHAIPFYLRHGFVAEGEEYLDAGIPHRSMYFNFKD